MRGFILYLFLVSNVAAASGTLIVQPSYSMLTGGVLMSGGLAVYKTTDLFPAAYSGFIGVSELESPTESAAYWAAATLHEIEIALTAKTRISPGVRASYILASGEWRNSIHLRLSYNLW
jgi:hypothetical protein